VLVAIENMDICYTNGDFHVKRINLLGCLTTYIFYFLFFLWCPSAYAPGSTSAFIAYCTIPVLDIPNFPPPVPRCHAP
jgi:hypothetical protein